MYISYAISKGCLSGKTPTNNTKPNLRTLAKANGASNNNGSSGYDMTAHFQITYWQCMYVLKYKNLDSQATVGRGYGTETAKTTGTLNTSGMTWGNTSDKGYHVKLFGIEDAWFGGWWWFEGCYSDDNHHLRVTTDNFDNESNYIDVGLIFASDETSWCWVAKVMGTTLGGFNICGRSEGSGTTYYCDCADTFAGKSMAMGSTTYSNANNEAGIFARDNRQSASETYPYARLMFL